MSRQRSRRATVTVPEEAGPSRPTVVPIERDNGDSDDIRPRPINGELFSLLIARCENISERVCNIRHSIIALIDNYHESTTLSPNKEQLSYIIWWLGVLRRHDVVLEDLVKVANDRIIKTSAATSELQEADEILKYYENLDYDALT